MDYMVGVYALFRQLQQVANIAVDFLDEDDLTAEGLASLKLLIVTEPDIPTEGQAAIATWMKAGGNVLTLTGAGAYDRYHRPSTTLSDVTGIIEAPRERLMVAYASTLNTVANGTGELGDFTANGLRGQLTSFDSANFKILANYSNGDPAIVSRDVGKGRVTHFTFFPGIRHHDGSPYHAVPHFNNRTNFTDGSLPYLLDCVANAGAQPRVSVSELQVETPLLSSDAGAVLTLLNWRETPVAALDVSVHLAYDVDQVTAVQANVSVRFTSTPAAGASGGYFVNFTLPLEHGDFVTLRAKQVA
jgi:hypothetical protein